MAQHRHHMSKDTQFILDTIAKSDKLREKNLHLRDQAISSQIKTVLQSQEAGFDCLAMKIETLTKELEEVKQAKKEQNGRVDKLEKVTWLNKFVNDRPKMSIFLFISMYLGFAELVKHISISELIKKILP